MLCLPIGVLAAIYLEEFAPKNRLTDLIEVNINNLAAVPSIVFGLLGLAVFLNFFGLPRSAPLVGGLVLALLVLPTIIIAARAALKAVPPSIKEAALGVGASHQQAVFHHVLPLAMPGIMTGTIIGMAHALGETAPLLMIGMVAFIVDVPQEPHRRGDRPAGADLPVVGSARARLPVQDGGRHHRAAGVPVRHERHGDLAAQEIRAPLVGRTRRGCHGHGGATMSRPRCEPPRPSRGQTAKVVARDVNVYYGEKHALKDVNVDIPEQGRDGLHRPVGLRQVDVPALHQPHERHHPELPRHRQDRDRQARTSTTPALDVVQLRARVGMVFQKPNPFPKSIFENVAYGPRIHGLARSKAELEEIVRREPEARRACSRR